MASWSRGIEGTGSPSDCALNGQTGWEEEVKMPPGLNQRLQVTGLCGNFNNDGADDQRAPSGLIHPSAALFGDSWRLHSYCPRAVPVQDTCSIYSHRKHWAIKKCSILKSDVFHTCHTEVCPSWPASYKCQSDYIGPFPGPSIPLPVSVCYRHLRL